jgi:hypothetical protein
MLVYLLAFWSILRPFGIFCGHWVYLVAIGYLYFSLFGMSHQDKSGNPNVDQPGVDFTPFQHKIYGLSLFLESWTRFRTFG